MLRGNSSGRDALAVVALRHLVAFVPAEVARILRVSLAVRQANWVATKFKTQSKFAVVWNRQERHERTEESELSFGIRKR
jgi:hypothetical protein